MSQSQTSQDSHSLEMFDFEDPVDIVMNCDTTVKQDAIRDEVRQQVPDVLFTSNPVHRYMWVTRE